MAETSVEQNPWTRLPWTAQGLALRDQAMTLPVSKEMPRIKAAIKRSSVVILVSETGSGKTTQVGKHLLLEPWIKGKIALTQPRRIAAQLMYERIATETDTQPGALIGLRMKGTNETCSSTRLEVCTDGLLLAKAQGDCDLKQYGAIIIDEAHQHEIPTDLLLGLLKDLAVSRKDDLKIVIMSATMNAAQFQDFFPGSELVDVQGRSHPVDVQYLSSPPAGDAIVRAVFQQHLCGPSGNFLVFVSGVRDMSKIIKDIDAAFAEGKDRRFDPDIVGPLACYPLHAGLTAEEQDAAVHHDAPMRMNADGTCIPGRKVIVSTNIAEASVTIAGVTCVFDSLKVKTKVWNAHQESWSLVEQPISKAQARQRAGRAGRTRAGKAFRMCTERGFLEDLPEYPVPAIMESDLLDVCLSVFALNRNPTTFNWISTPASETVAKALGFLVQFKALDQTCREVTMRGKQLARLPISVYSATAVLEASTDKLDCSDEMISLVSMVEALDGGLSLFRAAVTKEQKDRITEVRQEFGCRTGDHIMLFNLFVAWKGACQGPDGGSGFVSANMLNIRLLREADRIRQQVLGIVASDPLFKGFQVRYLPRTTPGYYNYLLQALARGNFLRVAKRTAAARGKGSDRYTISRSTAVVELSKDTDLGPPTQLNEWVMYNEFDGKDDEIKLVTPIPPQYLVQARPAYFWDLLSFPAPSIRNSIARVISGMIGCTEAEVHAAMPPKPT